MHRRPFPKAQPSGAGAHEKNRRIGFVIDGFGRRRSSDRLRLADKVKVAAHCRPEISRLLNRQVERSFEAGAEGGGACLIPIDNAELARRFFRLQGFPDGRGRA